MNNSIDEEIVSIAPYSIYGNKIPKIDRVSSIYLDFINIYFKNKPLKTISTVIMTRYSRYEVAYGEQFSINFFIFGTFRKHYTVIESMANILSPIFSEMHVLPIITPVLNKEWQYQEITQGKVYNEIQNFGIIVYSKSVKE